jgi:hypothetical protein
MFNLEQSITEWRQQMLAAGIQNQKLLDELESHLREEAGLQMKSGLDAEKAFAAAVRQIGEAILLKREFKKVGGVSVWLERLMIAIAAAFVSLTIFLGGAAMWMCYSSWTDRIMPGIVLACTVAVACRWKYFLPFLPVITGKWKRLGVTVVCMPCGFMAGSFLMDIILPHFVAARRVEEIPMIFWTAFIGTVIFCLGIGLGLGEKEREAMGIRKREVKSHV